MCRFALAAAAVVGWAAVLPAQQPIEKYRLLTGGPLNFLAFAVSQTPTKFDTADLNDRLSNKAPATALMVTEPDVTDANRDRVWYTDPATTTPIKLVVTRRDHTILWDYSATRSQDVFKFRIETTTRPVNETISEMVNGMIVTRTVTRMVQVTTGPSDPEVKAVLDAAAAITNRDARSLTELAVSAKLAELYPDDGLAKPNDRVGKLIADYRKTVLDQAVAKLKEKPVAELPPVGEPVFVGHLTKDPVAVARTVDGAAVKETRKIQGKDFAAVWDGSTLVLSQIRTNGIVPTEKVELNDKWRKALDPKVKNPPIIAYHLK